ncbi:hypothetical protein EI77_02163 [Prosthecobacter fusiformis]|uniref:Uncharacterized protein n=1 Tax=Prosthecobacter fusiformis TaxID=48464 RepID=A0A4R7S1G9_9BACT|nr:hypothetical protein [Prosthecobacter fusiformis]TDU71045.1 hypothetical protein EI77_02163 [Prosthecobacter fusiformis]
MHRILPWILLLVIGRMIHAEEEQALRAQPYLSPCEILCANLTKAIQERPDLMVMRLEDALVINEPCAGEIVTAAMDAVRAKPHLVQQIIETALKVAPGRSAMVMAAVNSYTPASQRPVIAMEEVRRAEIPASEPLMEIRRAESAVSNEPLLEIRRAEVAGSSEARPIEEIRRAEVSSNHGPGAKSGAVLSPADGQSHEEVRRAEFTVMAQPTSFSR